MHPRSKLQHQLDHILISRGDLCRFTDAGSWRRGQLLDSDHRAVQCSMRIVVRLQRKKDVRSKLARLDASVLRDDPARSAFAHNVLKRLDSGRTVSASLSLGAKDANGHVPAT